MNLEYKVDMKRFQRGMSEVAKKQLPFAMAQALTATAGRVGLAWQDEMRQRLDRPTPFTVNSVAVRPARKSDPTATVYVKDIAAEYLEPFVDGGVHFLGGKKGLLTPKNVTLNAYGNLTKNKLASLKAKPGVFVGPVQTKSGQVINGVWQRIGSGAAKRAKAARGRATGQQPAAGALKLLIRFSDPQTVKQRLDFSGRSDVAVRKFFEAEFAKAFANAMATAK